MKDLPFNRRLRPVGPAVIGLAGGVGAGKSQVAAILGELGCIVSDSDAQSRAALERPEVRDRLVGWWGAGVLGSDGLVDRRRIASIVFSDPEARRRLEGLVHPLIHQARAEEFTRANSAGVRAVVIDAPLLFEAGLDRECDAVIFVDSPPEVRLARVAAARGWDEAELRRREAAQLPLEEKRARCEHLVKNLGSTADLREQVKSVLEAILINLEGKRSPRPPRAG